MQEAAIREWRHLKPSRRKVVVAASSLFRNAVVMLLMVGGMKKFSEW
jgi:hypothetical protein